VNAARNAERGTRNGARWAPGGQQYRRPFALQAVVLVAVACVGCSSHQRAEDFIPAEAAARRALEVYLQAWQRGHNAVEVPNTSPKVMGGDSLHAAGRKLEGFTVVGPAPGDAPRCFAVRLNLSGPSEELRERYVVIGLDPIWVFRYPDYEMLMHWDHSMPAKK
jgi:hypothetical protein